MKTIIPAREHTREDAINGLSSFSCCEVFLSKNDLRTLRDWSSLGLRLPTSVYCVKCHQSLVISQVQQSVSYGSTPLLDLETAKGALWFHATRHENWLEKMTDGVWVDKDTHKLVPPYVHIGTRKAALEIAENYLGKIYPGETLGWGKFFLYEVTLTEDASILPDVLVDTNSWDDLVTERTKSKIGADGFRYLNSYEALGSISIMIDPNKLVVKKVNNVKKVNGKLIVTPT